MKFSCERQAIITAASVSQRASSPKSPVPELEGLLIEAFENGIVRITGYDLKIGIVTELEAEVGETGGVVLNAKLFCDIIRKMPNDYISVNVSPNSNTRLECGAAVYDIVGNHAADYPSLPVFDSKNMMAVNGRVLRDMINQTIFAVSSNESRPVLTGALFDIKDNELTIVAVDGYRLALRCEEIENSTFDSDSFIVPGTALSEVEKIAALNDGDVEITAGDKHVMFKMQGALLITRRIEGEFYNYSNAIPQNGKYSIGVNRRDIMNAVERVSIIISDKVKSPVICKFGDGIMSLQTVSAIGKANDECEIEGNGEKLEMGFNDKYLLDALRAAPSDDLVINLISAKSPCVILPGKDHKKNKFLYMIAAIVLSGSADA